MPHVSDAMKKHQAESAERAETESERPSDQAPQAPTATVAPAGKTLASQVNGKADFAEVLVAHHDRGGAITEEYRALRTSLLASCADEKFCYLVTSSLENEGKTVTCLNLALVMTERLDRRTIVVDCDLRKGRATSLFGALRRPGMAELLRGEVKLKEVVQRTAYPNLWFIPAGQARHEEVAELIGRAETGMIVSDLRRRYDYVLFDTPPINRVSDAGMLGQVTGEALLVVRMNKTRRESVDKATRLLHAADVKLAGIILTHQKYYIPEYLYRYS